jgi:hypothetical protein
MLHAYVQRFNVTFLGEKLGTKQGLDLPAKTAQVRTTQITRYYAGIRISSSEVS